MSHLAHLVSSAFHVREVPPLCTSSECNKARSRATSAADVHLVAQPVGVGEPGRKTRRASSSRQMRQLRFVQDMLVRSSTNDAADRLGGPLRLICKLTQRLL